MPKEGINGAENDFNENRQPSQSERFKLEMQDLMHLYENLTRKSPSIEIIIRDTIDRISTQELDIHTSEMTAIYSIFSACIERSKQRLSDNEVASEIAQLTTALSFLTAIETRSMMKRLIHSSR